MAACRGILLGLLSKTLFKAQSSQLTRLTLSRRGHQNAASRNCLLTTAPCMSPGLDPVPLSPHRTKTFPSQRTPTAGNAPQRSQEERPGGCGVVQISPPGLGRRPPHTHRPSAPAASNPTCCHQEDARGPCSWHSDSRGNAKASRRMPRSGQRPCGEPVGGRGPLTPCTGLQRADVKSRGGRPPGPGMRENAGQNWGGSAHTPQVARQHPRRLTTDPLLPPQSLKVMGRTSEATRKMPAARQARRSSARTPLGRCGGVGRRRSPRPAARRSRTAGRAQRSAPWRPRSGRGPFMCTRCRPCALESCLCLSVRCLLTGRGARVRTAG
ncbi:uncharacterized protein C13orf46 homolog isoform X2 [Orcinus orca]|uniref:uncharacterized protein C13orf46 homolog isoform X2 n=1 Tax=Orcinus orca TaxID=9733 RepID=UPI0021120966|nr:uncharacterized protein C13orf46 homolog isoform X2 [Orcinus orca]